MKPQHTPTPIRLLPTGDVIEIDGKCYGRGAIVRAVNAHESLIEDLAICLQSFGKDMQNDFRRRVESHLKEAIAKAEPR